MKSWCEIHRQFEWLFMVDEWNLVLKLSTVLESLLELGIELICQEVHTWIYLSLNRSIYFAIGTISWPWSYKLGHVKTTKIGAEEVHPPKNRLIFPQPEGYNYHFNSVFGHRTWLPASCACSTLPRSSLKRCNAWKIGLTWLTITWVDPWQRSTHHFSEYLATRDYD